MAMTKDRASKRAPKRLTATYVESASYRERGEGLDLIRVLLVIDGKDTIGEFSMRMPDPTAWKMQAMICHILKGMTPVEAFALAFPATPTESEAKPCPE